MALNSTIQLHIPDIDVLVQDEADMRKWVTSSLSEMIIARLKALKDASDELKALSGRAVVIDDPNLETRGVSFTMGGMQ